MTPTHTLYHGTADVFDAFSIDASISEGRATNGDLGVWLACENELASRFGEVALTVQADFSSTFPMPVSELQELHRQANLLAPAPARDFYTKVRKALVEKGMDSVVVIEMNGEYHMFIALDVDRLMITSFGDSRLSEKPKQK